MTTRRTKTQTAVLSLLRKQQGALSAYMLLDELRQTQPSISAPTVYRALAALIERGQVQRLESLNAYIASKEEGHEPPSILSICDDCGLVEQNAAPEVLEELTKLAGQTGFSTQRHVVEIHGRCANCDDGEAQA